MPDSNDIKKTQGCGSAFFADPSVFLNANSDQFIKVFQYNFVQNYLMASFL